MKRKELSQLLSQNGVLPTSQRLDIADILLAKPQHLSADQIIASLKERRKSVSKATVYNTLNLFGQRGIVREIMVDPVRKFYDSTTHEHHHFYNVDSGELHDIPVDCISLTEVPALPAGTCQDGVDVIIRVKNR